MEMPEELGNNVEELLIFSNITVKDVFGIKRCACKVQELVCTPSLQRVVPQTVSRWSCSDNKLDKGSTV